LSRPARTLALTAALITCWLAVASCSLVVDPGQLQDGCENGTKACDVNGSKRCVSTSDPDYGCARDSCVPCILTQAVEVCGANGECAVGTCEPRYENCDLLARTGCEVDLDSDYDHCGGCGSSCDAALRSMDHTRSSRCSAGRCVVDECEDGYADSDGAASNGCELALP
jgi:hypothetical protein